MQKVEDLKSEPVVGKYYLVRCVLSTDEFPEHLKGWRPVIGEKHEDKEIGVEFEHYHYDVRFFYEWQLGSYYKRDATKEAATLISVYSTKKRQSEIEYRRRRCNRRMPDFPLTHNAKKSHIAVKLEEIYKDVELKCMKCPHRGFDLTQLPVKDGVVICNGHGLAWNVKTGKMIPREVAA